MTLPRVLLLEAAGPESGAVAAAARAVGVDLYAATTAAMHARYSPDLRASLAGVLLTDFADPDRAEAGLLSFAAGHRIGGILTLHEFLTPLVARVCGKLGLPGNDPVLASAARNKAAMAERFATRGVPAPATRVVSAEADLKTVLDAGRLGWPVVVKPAENAGSLAVAVAVTLDEAIAAFHQARSHTRQPHYGLALDDRILLQEHIDGTEVSVESLTQNGTTTHLAITRKHTTGGTTRVELGHTLPADLPTSDAAAILDAADQAISAVGIRNSASHTEIILTPDRRCVVVEIAARLGSGQIGFLLQHALGIDPWTALLHLALGRPTRLTPTRAHYATVRFLTAPAAGHLAVVHGLPSTGGEIPDVRLRAQIGDPVRPPENNADRLGHILLTGAEPRDLEERARHALDAITIKVSDPAAPSPQEFDALYSGGHGGFSQVLRAVDPGLPDRLEAFSFLTRDLLEAIARQLALTPGRTLVDLGCGRGGPDLHLATAADAALIGVDFSPVALDHARTLANPTRAQFVLGTLTVTGLPDHCADAVVSIDALQYAQPRTDALTEARRVLRPGGRLVLTGWHPHTAGDPRLPPRHRDTDWPAQLHDAGFTAIGLHHAPGWDTAYQGVYRQALGLGDPGADRALAALQSEARHRLATAHLLHRVLVAATAP